MAEDSEGPAGTWVREYNAQTITLDQLADRIAAHDFRPRKGGAARPSATRALEYRDANYEPGTFDDVYRAKAFGLLTRHDMTTIMERMEEQRAKKDKPQHTCAGSEEPSAAALIELKPAPEPYLIAVDGRYIKVLVSS